MEVMLTISGTPAVGERGQDAQLHAHARSPTSRPSRGRSRRATTAGFDGYPFVRFWSVWNEPNLSRFLTPQFDARRQVRRAGQLREAVRGRLDGHQGGQPARQGRDRRDLRTRERQAAGPAARRTRRQVRRARRQGEPAAQVRRVVASPVPVQPELGARPARQVAERLARLAAPLQHGAQALVQAQVRADLDHRVRARDEARGSLRRPVRDPGAVHPAVDRDGREATRSSGCSSGSSTRTTRASRGTRGSMPGAVAPKGSSPRVFAASAQPLDARNAIVLVPCRHADPARQPPHAPLLRR